jgi:bifunctional non-homologous end joining protein LigD
MPATPVVAAPDVGTPRNLPLVEPQALTPQADPFDHPGWLFEPKYDGFRGLLYNSDQACEIRMTEEIGGPAIRDLPARVAEVLAGRETILDGEIVALDRQGRPDLQLLLRGGGYLAFAAFDLLWQDGHDLRDLPLKERKARLAELLPEDTGPLYKVLSIEEHGRALFGAIRRMELGGIVAKCLDDPYSPRTVWYEIRNEASRSPMDSARFPNSLALTSVPRLV